MQTWIVWFTIALLGFSASEKRDIAEIIFCKIQVIEKTFNEASTALSTDVNT